MTWGGTGGWEHLQVLPCQAVLPLSIPQHGQAVLPLLALGQAFRPEVAEAAILLQKTGVLEEVQSPAVLLSHVQRLHGQGRRDAVW